MAEENKDSKWEGKSTAECPIQRTLSYEITENNLGFRCYVANMKVIDIEGGCKIEWSFMSDAVEGMRLEDLLGIEKSNLETVVEGMRKEIQAMEIEINSIFMVFVLC
ncbi:hypothetical protein L1987_86894 [Smallanthus sonchifolius]|uniref:Uncharacterized protein n=1 Tax=Smallanthus sonchifolius TaxID=185202 RepID=A0ACB8Y1N0_9ASTR|nr:hypothetical protein L1987_86894 [Smallanthus sonchifolius]